jgi:hypothetical protein
MAAIFKTEFRDLEYEKAGEKRKAKASTCKLVLLAIADNANDYGEGSYPGYEKLVIKTALSRQGLADTIDALKYNGLLSVSESKSRLGTNNYTVNTRCIPSLMDETSATIVEGRVKPLDSTESSHLTPPSQATGLNPYSTSSTPVAQKPTIQEQADRKVDAILELEAQVEKQKVKAWTYREKFTFNQDMLDLADLAQARFGPPSKKDLSLWIMEIGDWCDFGCRAKDWPRAIQIVSTFTTPVLSITGMTKAIRAACQERKTPAPQENNPAYKKYVPPEGNYVPRPANLPKPNFHRPSIADV